MASVSMSGLVSGVDTGAIVQQLVAVEQQSVTRLQARKATIDATGSAFSTIADRIASLKTALEDLRSASSLRAYSVSSSDDSVLTASATSTASEGAHTIVINRLASSERKVNAGTAALDTLVGVGAFVYTYGGETRTVQTTDTTTLEGLRDLINNDGGNPGITASILQYGTGDQAFHLVLSGNDMGADHTIAIDDGQTTLDAFDSGAFITTQTAQNSRIQLDGYPSGDNWIERDGNTLTDVLTGVTLDLREVTPSGQPVRLSLTRDTSGLKDKLAGLVSAYNSVISEAKTDTAYDATAKKSGPLIGEYSVTSILEKLRTPLVQRAAGFSAAEDPYSLSAQLGLSVDKDGKLQLNEDDFNTAVSNNYLGVLSLLGAERSGTASGANLRFYGARDTTSPGTYDVRANFTDGVLTSASIKLSSEPDSAWRDAKVDGNLIIGAEGKPEQNLQVTAAYAGTGTTTAQVRVRQGVCGQLYDAIGGSIQNILDSAKSRVETQSKHMQDNIDSEQLRVNKVQGDLAARFAKLEQTLTMLQAQRGALSSLVTSSSSSG